MESNHDDSATESEGEHDPLEDDDDDDHHPTQALGADRSSYTVHAPAATSMVSSTSSRPLTAWNNVLALALAPPSAATPQPTTTPASPLPPGGFVSPFAVLQPEGAVQRNEDACPRCFGLVTGDDLASVETVEDEDEEELLLSFCVCCQRSLPRELLRGNLPYALRCSTCARKASAASPGLLDTLVAELPSHVRIAADVDRALDNEETFLREYDAKCERYAKLRVRNDSRIREINAVEATLSDAIVSNTSKRRAAMRGRKSTTLSDWRALFHEWITLEKQRVSLMLQRLVALDQILGEHFLQSPSTVADFFKSIHLTPVEPFPMREEFDASEQCSECEVVLSRPAPVGGDGPVAVGFCDCCRRLLPKQDVHPARRKSTVSFCLSCQRRRDFSLISDANIVGIPDLDWCKQFSQAGNRFKHDFEHSDHKLPDVLTGRLVEASQDVTHSLRRVSGLEYRLPAVVREGNTSMEASRHWYAEHSAACHALVGAALKRLLVATDIGESSHFRSAWKPVVDIVQNPDGYSEHTLPEWLTTFINERWPKNASKLNTSGPTVLNPPKATKQTPPRAAEPTQPLVVIEPAREPSSATARPPASVNKPAPSVSKPAANHARALPSGTQDSQPKTAKKTESTCTRCAQVLQIPLFDATKIVSHCDCCELVLPKPSIHMPQLHPRVTLCTACFQVQGKKSPEEINMLARREGDTQIDQLWAILNALKGCLSPGDTKAGATPDSRRLSAAQEVERCKKERKTLSKRLVRALSDKKIDVKTLHKLYSERIQSNAMMFESMFELIQVQVETVNQRGVQLSKKIRGWVNTLLKDKSLEVDNPAGGNHKDEAPQAAQNSAETIGDPHVLDLAGNNRTPHVQCASGTSQGPSVQRTVSQNKTPPDQRATGKNAQPHIYRSDERCHRTRSPEWTTPQMRQSQYGHTDGDYRYRHSHERSRSPPRHYPRETNGRSHSWGRERADLRPHERYRVDEYDRMSRSDYVREDPRYRSRSRERHEGHTRWEKRPRYY